MMCVCTIIQHCCPRLWLMVEHTHSLDIAECHTNDLFLALNHTVPKINRQNYTNNSGIVQALKDVTLVDNNCFQVAGITLRLHLSECCCCETGSYWRCVASGCDDRNIIFRGRGQINLLQEQLEVPPPFNNNAICLTTQEDAISNVIQKVMQPEREGQHLRHQLLL